MDKISRYQGAAGKQYLGDAVYWEFDGFHVILTTSNGLAETNRICLDPSVCERFIMNYERLKGAIEEMMGETDGSGTRQVRPGVHDSASPDEGTGSDPGGDSGVEG